MLNKIIQQAYSWLSGVQPLPPNETLTLAVMLESLLVGTLRAEKGEWVFEYSEQFKKQKEIMPIIDFPSVDREYRSRELWPFFALRIPSPEQSSVKAYMNRNSLETVDEGILLREFGGRSISNPFRLVPAAA
jgi:HipA-like protein